MKIKCSNLLCPLAMLGALLLPSLGATQTLGERNWGVSLGAFLTDHDFETELTARGSGEVFVIDLEDDLGLESDNTVFRLDAFWRPSGKHRLDLSWFDLSRDADVVVETEFEWQDTVFPVDIDVSTDLDLSIYKLAYGYEFVQNERSWFAGSFGLFIGDLGLRIEDVTTGGFEAGDITAPLPVLGIRGGYAITDKWVISYSGEAFFLEFDKYEGDIYDAFASIEYRFTERFAVSAGYNYVTVSVDIDDQDLNADLDYRFSGIVASLKLAF